MLVLYFHALEQTLVFAFCLVSEPLTHFNQILSAYSKLFEVPHQFYNLFTEFLQSWEY